MELRALRYRIRDARGAVRADGPSCITKVVTIWQSRYSNEKDAYAHFQ